MLNYSAQAPRKESAVEFHQDVALRMMTAIGDHAKAPLSTMLTEYMSTSGKFLRSRLIGQFAQTLGVPREDVMPWAVACELVHEASLIHDDLQDRDQYRRGQPSFWKRYGENLAINAGDFLLALSSQVLKRESEYLRDLHFRILNDLVHGQIHEEVQKRRIPDSNVIAHYCAWVEGKTAALFEGLFVGVAHLAGRSERDICSCCPSLRQLGVLFQMQDDVLDLYGNKGRRQQGSDLREGKVSALIAWHIHRHPEDRQEIVSVLESAQTRVNDADVRFLHELFLRKKTVRSVIDEMMRLRTEMKKCAWEEMRPVLTQIVDLFLQPIQQLIQVEYEPNSRY